MAEEKAKELAPKEVMRRPLSRWNLDPWFDESLLKPFPTSGCH
jgi:hypothetical protein